MSALQIAGKKRCAFKDNICPYLGVMFCEFEGVVIFNEARTPMCILRWPDGVWIGSKKES